MEIPDTLDLRAKVAELEAAGLRTKFKYKPLIAGQQAKNVE